MRTAASTRLRQAGVVLVASLSVLGTTGCQVVNPQATTTMYAPSDGVSGSVGDVQLRNIFVAAAAKGDPGRLGGALFNGADRQTTVTLRGASGAETRLNLPANADYYLAQKPKVTFDAVGQRPGALIEMTVTVAGSGASTKLQVPVVDGTLEEYRTLVPGAPTPTGTPTSTPTATTSPSPGQG